MEPVLLEVKEHCSFADFFIICSGASKRQVVALAEHLQEELAQARVKPLGVEGIQEGLWVLMDYNTLVVHIFYQELREFYDLEGLWADALKTDITPPPSAMSAISAVPEAVQSSGKSESSNHE